MSEGIFGSVEVSVGGIQHEFVFEETVFSAIGKGTEAWCFFPLAKVGVDMSMGGVG